MSLTAFIIVFVYHAGHQLRQAIIGLQLKQVSRQWSFDDELCIVTIIVGAIEKG